MYMYDDYMYLRITDTNEMMYMKDEYRTKYKKQDKPNKPPPPLPGTCIHVCTCRCAPVVLYTCTCMYMYVASLKIVLKR